MRLQHRLRKLNAAMPKCDREIQRVVVGEYVPAEDDRCRLCGGCHVLVIKRKVVTRRDLVAREVQV
ncbi:MAG: hypothetical protein K8U57_04365 [Planctomycetes bacterium]|nr:hypothetical protein [Planctomycetota bacterium]